MVTDDVDHAAHRPVGIVDVGRTVDEARAEMEERRCRLVAHPVIPVGGAGHDALEEAQHAAHPVDPVKRGDKMHLRRAGIGKTHLDPSPTSVRTRLSAPFILSLRSASSASCKFLPCLSGCYPSTLSIECANWELSAAPALPLDRQRERAKLLMVDFDLDVVGGADGFELRSELCGDEDESLVFFQAGMM